MPKGERFSLQAEIGRATGVLAAAGVASPRVDAELLAVYLTGTARGRLSRSPGLTAEQAARYQRLVAARARRVPLQHLTGTAPFRRLELAVGPGVFVPRPETELLVEWGLAALRGLAGQRGPAGRSEPAVVVDLCSGSGAVALAVAQEYPGGREHPGARVYAVEADAGALRWLRRNAGDRARAGDPPIVVVPGDATGPGVLSELDGTVDLVLCNPPYLPLGTPVEPEVAGYDPAGALFAGPDGLAVIPGIVERAATLLRDGGLLGIEHDASHGEAVAELLRAHGRYEAVTGHRDLAGRPRFATARGHLVTMP